MLVLLDIGNTAATYGIYDGGRLLSSGSSLYNGIPIIVSKTLRSGRSKDINLIISSVVPKITKKYSKEFAKNKRIKLWIVGKNLPIPVKHRYKSAKKLGTDRLVNIYGALKMYKPPLLMIDYGTAITFDYVAENSVFEGGMIIPGPEISFQSLVNRAAQLPKTRLPKKAPGFIGRSTYDCMASGILQGYGAMTDGLIERFKSKYGRNLKVIATGGFAGHLKPFVSSFDILDPLHSIKSLLLLYKEK
jgi:type III pantothenate kinase